MQLFDMFKYNNTLFAFLWKHPQRLPTIVTDALNNNKQGIIKV